jgi:hypothetical protein
MPNTLIKTGKNKGKYRTPSGRIISAKQHKLQMLTEDWKHMGKAIRLKKKK